MFSEWCASGGLHLCVLVWAILSLSKPGLSTGGSEQARTLKHHPTQCGRLVPIPPYWSMRSLPYKFDCVWKLTRPVLIRHQITEFITNGFVRNGSIDYFNKEPWCPRTASGVLVWILFQQRALVSSGYGQTG